MYSAVQCDAVHRQLLPIDTVQYGMRGRLCIVLYYMYNTTPSAGLPLQVMQLVCPIYCSMLHSEILQINRLPLQVI